MESFIVQVRVEAFDRNGKAIVRRIIPVTVHKSQKRGGLKAITVDDVKTSIRKLLGVPLGDQELFGPLPSRQVLSGKETLVQWGIIPGIRRERHSDVSAGELFTTVGVAAARDRLRLQQVSASSSPSDVLVLETKHPLREYILSDGFYYQRFQNPCVRFVVYALAYLTGAALVCLLLYWLWQVGKLALPKPKVWLNIEKKLLKIIMLQELDEDIPQDVREQLEKMEL